jgi:hypothetical protein
LFLKRERVTQVILVTATDYQLPAPLNPWAVEDGNLLKALEDQNLWPVSDISDKWNKQPNAAALQALLDEEIGKNEKSEEPLIVHISMHGVVNDDNKPCLLPPGPPALDAKTWIPVEDVLKQIDDAMGDERKALVILDCHRIRANWQLGIVYNTFTERLQQLLGSNPYPNVAVLCSAGPGQMNWASSDLNGSSFGRYLQLGLAGEADNAEGADGNGAVSLHELVAYLKGEVSTWSESNRGEPQRPTLIPAGAEDFHLTWNVRGYGTLTGYVSELREQKRSEPTIPPSDMEGLWSQLDELRSLDSDADVTADLGKLQPLGLVRTDPLFCRDLEHGVLRVEALSRAGLAYQQSAGDQFTRLKAKLSDALKQKNRTENSRALADHLGYAKVDEWARIRTAAHSLPAAEYFGASDADSSKDVQSIWETLATPSAGDSSSVTTGGSQGGIAGDLAETQLLIAAKEQGIDSLWPAGEAYALKSVLTRRSRAEELAVPRALDGAPGDERAHYFARIALKAADERRRLAEDVLFIGPQSTQDYAELASAAEEIYDWTSKVMQEATGAYAVRDAALAEAPYLGYWLCGPAIASVQDRKNLVNELLGLVRQGHDLDDEISHPERLDDAEGLPVKSGLPFSPLAGEVLKHHRSLRGAYQQKYEDLLDKGAQGPGGWSALDCALTTPLIPAAKRSELVAMRDEVSKNLFKEYFEKQAGAQANSTENDSDKPSSTADAESASPYLRELQTWGSHPLVEILLPGDEGNAVAHDVAWCDNVAKRLRERLSGPASSNTGGDGGEQDPSGDDVIRDRHQLSKAERALRASAAIGFGLGGMKSDPVFELRQFDLRQLLVAHGERAMEDFWGEVSQAGVEDPFFVRAAKHYLDAARNLGTPTPAVRLYLDQLQVRLAELEKSKRQPLQIRAATELVNERRGDVAVRLEIAAKSSNYPPGHAAVYLRRESGERLDCQFKESTSAAGPFLQYPPRSARQNFMMSITGAPTDQPKVEAVSFFRGQEDLTSFILPTFKGLSIEYDPYVYDGQTITLFGDRPEQLSLVFILDCSNSMDEKSRVEARRPIMRQRLDLATTNLGSMLDDIVKRNREGEGTRVGVRFYGHRLGWISQGDELAKQEDYKGTIPDDLTPSEDVELVQPLGRFDGGVASKIDVLLNSLEPWGETPLYLSLMQALDDFNSDGAETRKSIIAITDGEDYQSLHNLNGPKPQPTTLDMLLAAWERSKFRPPIHILGFDIAANQAAAAREAFERIKKRTGGSYKEIKSGADLLTELREHLNVAGIPLRTPTATLLMQPIKTPRQRSNSVRRCRFPIPRTFRRTFKSASATCRLNWFGSKAARHWSCGSRKAARFTTSSHGTTIGARRCNWQT